VENGDGIALGDLRRTQHARQDAEFSRIAAQQLGDRHFLRCSRFVIPEVGGNLPIVGPHDQPFAARLDLADGFQSVGNAEGKQQNEQQGSGNDQPAERRCRGQFIHMNHPVENNAL